jgi:hypothetical protein
MMQNKMQLKKIIKIAIGSFFAIFFFTSTSFNNISSVVSFDSCKDINKALCKKNILLRTTKDSMQLRNIDTHAPIWLTNQPKIINNLPVAMITVCCQTTYTSETKPYRYCYSSTFYYKDRVIYVINQALEPQVWLDLRSKKKVQKLYPSSLGGSPVLQKVSYCSQLKDSLYYIETSTVKKSHDRNGQVRGFVFSDKYGIIQMDYTIKTQGSSTYILK